MREKVTGTNEKFERVCKKAGIPIYSHCQCGTTFCQHDQFVRDSFNDYAGETLGAYRMWVHLQKGGKA
jgi:hypothetical protein